MVRWKDFQSKEETFSWKGGKIFVFRWKENHATFYKRGKIFVAMKPVIFQRRKDFHGKNTRFSSNMEQAERRFMQKNNEETQISEA